MIKYTADVFCDGPECIDWTPGITGLAPAGKKETRERVSREGYVHIEGKDYCPACAAKILKTHRRG